MTYLRMVLVIGTALFMAYHTSIFIQSIEPAVVLAWLLALLIEGFLVSLALMKTTVSRILLIPLFIVSVFAASLSFVARNESLLERLLSQGRLIEQIREDLQRTQEAYNYGERYITKTLQRERALQDQLRELLLQRTGELAMAKAVVFFVLVLVVQLVSVYTAMSLKKNPAIFSPDIRRDVMKESPETVAETPTETTVSEPVSGNGGTPDETAQNTASGTLAETPVSDVSELVRKTGLSRSTVYRYLRGQKVSTEVMQKIRQAMS